jgi:hypothetical protein
MEIKKRKEQSMGERSGNNRKEDESGAQRVADLDRTPRPQEETD